MATRPHAGGARVLSNLPVSPVDHVLSLQLPHGVDRGRPGQFWQFRRGEALDPLLGRPLSTYDLSRVQPDVIELLLRVVGAGTRHLAQARPGERVFLTGPLGRPFEVAGQATRHVLVAGGVGVAPFPFLARVLKESGAQVLVLLGARTRDQLLGLDRFDALDVDLDLATDDGSAGVHGYVTELAAARLRPGDAVYCCGPDPMMAAVARLCAEAGVDCQVSVEQRMACGVGVCNGCVAPLATPDGLRYLRTCVEGPALDASRIADWGGMG